MYVQKIYIFKSCTWKSVHILYLLYSDNIFAFCTLETKVHTMPQAQKNLIISDSKKCSFILPNIEQENINLRFLLALLFCNTNSSSLKKWDVSSSTLNTSSWKHREWLFQQVLVFSSNICSGSCVLELGDQESFGTQ